MTLGLCKAYACDDEQNAKELAEAIRNRNFQIITLTRPSNLANMRFFLPSEIDYLFQKLGACFSVKFPQDKYLAPFKQQLDNVIKNINLSEDVDIYNGFKSVLSSERKSPIEFGSLPKINPKKWTILVFQEAFFSKMHALNNYMVETIVRYCETLTKGKRLIVIVNFLHEFEDDDRLYWLLDYSQSEKCFQSSSVLLDIYTPLLFSYNHQISGVEYQGENVIYKPLFVSGDQKPLDFMLQGRNRLANYSLIIANGKPVSIYRKTFYTEEKNPLIDKGYVYEFGDMNTHPIPRKPCSSFFKLLFENNKVCRMFICGDLNIFSHKEKEKIFDETMVNEVSIIASNSISLSSSQIDAAPELLGIFPENSLIIHSDCRFGPLVGVLKKGEIRAYIPYNTLIKIEGGKIEKNKKYPLMDKNRLHTGIWGCFFDQRGCIMNFWSLDNGTSACKFFLGKSKKETVPMFNYPKK